MAATRGWAVGAAASGSQALGCCAVRRGSRWVGPGGCTADRRKAGGGTGCRPAVSAPGATFDVTWGAAPWRVVSVLA